MDLMKLFGTVIAVLFHPGSASKINGQRICRRGTERPCYKVSYIQDSRRRLTFEDARLACRMDGGELLSIETESEQQLMERFIQQLQAGDGDFWIGLRRSPHRYRAGTTSPGCPSQYYWLDGSKAKFRNWHWDEPSCGGEMCAVLYYQPSAPPDEEGHFLFQWNDDNCNSKNNFVCKYPEEKLPVFTEERNTAHAAPSLGPNIFSTTETDERIKIGLPESSDGRQKHKAILADPNRGRRQQLHLTPYKDRMPLVTLPNCLTPAVDSSMPADIMTKYPRAPPQDSQCDDYENVSCADRESGFVTNDIYETCKAQSQRQTGWVENEIYG
ncbi:Layilin [Nibea albiflora]|uniref:Layilin n=1 Tax=Nibea albiflora TaxID=240163 RepID=A0ACB7EK62_NIBAL|nr:Layilin [Nibea albiflora]